MWDDLKRLQQQREAKADNFVYARERYRQCLARKNGRLNEMPLDADPELHRLKNEMARAQDASYEAWCELVAYEASQRSALRHLRSTAGLPVGR